MCIPTCSRAFSTMLQGGGPSLVHVAVSSDLMKSCRVLLLGTQQGVCTCTTVLAYLHARSRLISTSASLRSCTWRCPECWPVAGARPSLRWQLRRRSWPLSDQMHPRPRYILKRRHPDCSNQAVQATIMGDQIEKSFCPSLHPRNACSLTVTSGYTLFLAMLSASGTSTRATF